MTGSPSPSQLNRGIAKIAARNVPGRENIVKTAIDFIDELSFLLSCAMVVEVSAREMLTFQSFCAMN